MDELPPFKFKNISYTYLKNTGDTDSYILNSLLNQSDLNEKIVELSNKYKLPVLKYGIVQNEYPATKKGIITNTWINGFKNEGAPIVKKWLSDITKYKGYSNFEKNVGFSWHDSNYEYVAIYLNIGSTLNEIKNNINTDQYILSPEFYDKALSILKKKINKPLQILFFYNLDIDSNFLFLYTKVFKKYGHIIIDENLSQVNQLFLLSKVDHYIGSTHFIIVSAYLYEKKNSIVIVNSNNTAKIKYNPKNYPNNWMFIEDNSFRIVDNRGLNKYELDILSNIRIVPIKDQYQISKVMFDTRKDIIKELYEKYYQEYDKVVKNQYLKDLLLYRIIFNNNQFYILNSNINIKEGIMLYNLIKLHKPKKLIEIGFACGVSTAFMLCAMTKKDKLYSIDPFQKIQWDKFGLIVANEVMKEQKLTSKNHEWIGAYSGTYFENTTETYDLVFIDGDHSYKGTMIDLLGANKVLKKGGLLVIDDVLHNDVRNALRDFLKKQNNNNKNNNKNNNIKYKLINDVNTMNAYIKLY
jgi:predicted O-methyltransferase YrrM